MLDKDVENYPSVGSVWRHYNGNLYTVTGIANLYTQDSQKYPVHVIYKGPGDRVWTRPRNDWYRSMTLVVGDGGNQ